MSSRTRSVIVVMMLTGVIIWAYRPTLAELAGRWADDPQYSHGYIVPLFAAYLLWARRRESGFESWAPSWWGVAALIGGLGLWAAGTHFFLGWFAEVSLLVCAAGVALVMGGWPAMRWALPSVLFLGFMVPLPYRVQTALGGGLQRVASAMSTYLLQTFGAPALREGNVILIDDVKVGVVEACSGLGMLMTFFALAAGVALLVRTAQPWLRLTLVASAVPVAVLANVVRITITGMLYHAANDRLARVVFHDVAGWLMMPLAVGMLLVELHVLRRLITTEPIRVEADASLFGVPRPAAKASRPGRGTAATALAGAAQT